jgi:hypothetical protein
MTHTLPKRITRSAPAPGDALAQTQAHATEALAAALDWRLDSSHEVTDLAATLRSLALRAYHAVRDAGQQDDLVLAELRDLKQEIGRLQFELRKHKLDLLLPYVTALSRQVEAKLG